MANERPHERPMVGIIGGTGIGERLEAYGGRPLHVPTPAGMLHGRTVKIDGVELFLIRRHSGGHKVPPHMVNYRAMAYGMKALGVKACFSTAAVGSLHVDWPAGTLVACSDFLDLTGRFQTLFDRTVVHRDFSEPFSERGRACLLAAAEAEGIPIRDRGVYFSGNGPRYETPFEIELYLQIHGDVVGMTAATEAILMREAGVDYACLAIVTNLAAGISPTPLNHQEVVDEMLISGEKALRLLIGAAKRAIAA